MESASDNIEIDPNTPDQVVINKVLNNPILNECVNNLNEPGVLNLIDPKWKQILHNNPLYQKFKDRKVLFGNAKRIQDKAHVMYHIISKDDHFQVLIAGNFRVHTQNESNSHIKVTHCKPLEEIAAVMCKEDKELKIYSNCIFYMPSCNGICPACLKLDNKDENNKWCVVETQVYTQNGISCTTRSYCEKYFSQEFIGILRVNINMKYYFGGDGAKIGGTLKSIIFIPDNSLRSKKKIKILSLDNTNFIPTIVDNEESNVIPTTVDDEETNTIYGIPLGMKMKEDSDEEFEISSKRLKLDDSFLEPQHGDKNV